ncbi:MAG: STAS/SEC14 domain-containing protein [Bauldia sp.]|nr:STAS/SEC14 domain-containing protein [Bauldia sp.]
MITEIAGMPGRVLGFSLEGMITKADYHDVLIPTAEAALKEGHKLRVMIVAGPAFEGYEPGAMWDDTAFGFRHFFDFERVAFVSDNEAYGAAVRTVGFLMPAMVQVFPVKDTDKAKAWLAG